MSTLNIVNIVLLSVVGVLFLWSMTVGPVLKKKMIAKREEKLEKTVASFKQGDKILLASGIRGYFIKYKGDVIHVKIADNVVIKVDHHAVMGVYK